MQDNRQYLKAIIEVIILCARQGIALMLHREDEKSLDKAIFLALLDLFPSITKPLLIA